MFSPILDGTMLAPGSRVLADAAGNPSVACVQTLLDLRAAGVEVIPCSGRNRSMLHEDARILGFNAYIGEMGGLLMFDHGKDDWCYFTADMDYDHFLRPYAPPGNRAHGRMRQTR